MGPSPSRDFKNGALAFYPFLRRNRAAFIKCSFLLPGLKAAMLESPLSSKPMDNEKSGRGKSQTGDQKGGHMVRIYFYTFFVAVPSIDSTFLPFFLTTDA
jgi:hypothetical protein